MRLAALALVLALGACKKQEEPASNRPQPISEAERTRGSQACDAYVARLCACAETKPALAERCHLHKGRPQALGLALSTADSPDVEARDIFLAQEAARQVIAKCIEDTAQLDAEGCP